LTDVGFAGPYSIELEFQGEPWPALADVETALRSSREFLRPYLPEQDLGAAS
jgi:hypothetical protein